MATPGTTPTIPKTQFLSEADAVPPRMTFKKAFEWFIPQMRPLLRAHLSSVLFIVLGGSMFLLDPLMIKWMIDVVFPKRDLRLLVLAGFAFFTIYLARLAFNWIGSLINFSTVQKLVFRMRLNLLKHINALSPEFHETTPVAEKFYRIEKDVDQVSDIGGDFVPYVLRMTFNMIFVLATMLVLNFRLTCMVLPLLPIFFILKKRFRDNLRRSSEIAERKSSRAHSFLQEHLGALIQVQLLRRELTQTRTFAHFSSDRSRALSSRRSIEVAFSTSCLVIVVFGTIAVLSYGGYQVLRGTLTIGGFVAFYSYLGRLFDPMNGAIEIYSRLNRVSISISRIFEITELVSTVSEHCRPLTLPATISGPIRIGSVSFGYRNYPPLLEGLQLVIREGEKVALIGPSGSGKSTILKLIARLYDPDQGEVLIDQTDVRRVKLDSLRKTICYLPQEVVLFDRTFKENLLLGNPDASQEELSEAVHIAILDDVVASLKDRYDTQLGPRGGKLSVGEKQRVAIARAVLQRPRVMLLDECTSAVDVPTEKSIFRNLTNHLPHHTMVFVSHRVTALEWVDRIIVLDHGTIREQGTHDQLMRKGGLYRALHGKLDSPMVSPTHV